MIIGADLLEPLIEAALQWGKTHPLQPSQLSKVVHHSQYKE